MHRSFTILPLLGLLAGPVFADARGIVLMDVMRLQEAAQILRAEGLEHAQGLNEDMLAGQGGDGWQVQVNAIYDPARMVETVRSSIEAQFVDISMEDAISFYTGDLGSEIVSLENSARAAISDETIEAVARAQYEEIAGTDDPRLALIETLITEGGMIDRNVTSAMNSNYQFMRGLSEGGAMEMTQDEMLADVAAQQEEITEDTTGWLYGYMLMAYSPLTDAELQAYIDFSRTQAGQAINRGLFEGFGAAYAEISYGLGRALSLNMTAQEL